MSREKRPASLAHKRRARESWAELPPEMAWMADSIGGKPKEPATTSTSSFARLIWLEGETFPSADDAMQAELRGYLAAYPPTPAQRVLWLEKIAEAQQWLASAATILQEGQRAGPRLQALEPRQAPRNG